MYFIDHCLINEVCFMNSQYNESNPCQLCNASQSRDTWVENPGMFTLCVYPIFYVRIHLYWSGISVPEFQGWEVDTIHFNCYPNYTC